MASSRTLETLLTTAMLRTGYANLASGRPTIQQGSSIVAQFLEAFNEAGRRMTLTHMWTWRQGRYAIEVDNTGTKPMATRTDGATVGSPWRYVLEPWIMGVGHELAFWKDGTVQGGSLQQVSPDQIFAAHAQRPNYLSWPSFFAVSPLRDSVEYLNNPRLSQRPKHEVLIYPVPYKALTVDLSVRMQFVGLSDFNEAPPWPEDFDDAVVTLTCAIVLRGGEAPRKGMSEQSELLSYQAQLEDLKKADRLNKSVVQSPSNRDVPRYRAVAPVYFNGNFVI